MMSPIGSSFDTFFKFFIFIFAFIFSFKIFKKPILVELQITFLIINLEFGVKRVSAIKNDAELGSENIV